MPYTFFTREFGLQTNSFIIFEKFLPPKNIPPHTITSITIKKCKHIRYGFISVIIILAGLLVAIFTSIQSLANVHGEITKSHYINSLIFPIMMFIMTIIISLLMLRTTKVMILKTGITSHYFTLRKFVKNKTLEPLILHLRKNFTQVNIIFND